MATLSCSGSHNRWRSLSKQTNVRRRRRFPLAEHLCSRLGRSRHNRATLSKRAKERKYVVPTSTRAFHSRQRRGKGAAGGRRLELARPGQGRARLYGRLPLEKPRRISAGPRSDYRFPHSQWAREIDYRLIKELWAFEANRIAVRFAYEWHDDSGRWFRSYGNENWEFDEAGLMRRRLASINDLPIKEADRKYHWPLGRRPDGHPGLSDLGF
ncbi:MAG TPA: DUF1348 family protein [Candidatus Binataceae bacterium]|nr:DUF1348 family protein [Candidatus Binataceae bacterium]